MTITEGIPLINQHIQCLTHALSTCNDADKSKALFDEQNQLKAFLHTLEMAEERLARLDAQSEDLAVGLTPSQLDGLPDKLVNQLSVAKREKPEFRIIAMIRAAGGTMDLDNLLIRYYKETGEILERIKLMNRLYRMTTRGMLHTIPKRKGIYTLHNPNEEKTLEEGNKENVTLKKEKL